MRIGMGLVLATVFAVPMATPMTAQQKPFDYHSKASLDTEAQQMASKAASAANGSANARVADYGDHAITMAARTQSGGPEIHEQWTDVILVTDGEATLLLGGTVVDRMPRGPEGSGEFGGKDITGGTEQVVRKGDIINIPAGTPHWIKLAPGAKFAYTNVKVKKQ